MNYDYELKKRIQQEKESYQVPEGYKRNVESILENLPETSKDQTRRWLVRQIAVYAIILALSSVTVAAGIALVHLGKGTIRYKNSSKKYQEIVNLKEIQENNGRVNMTKKSDGISFTIENIGLDRGNLMVYYKIQTDEKMELPGSDWESKWGRIQSILFDPRIVLDGESLTNLPSADEIYMIDTQTVRGVLRQNISKNLGQKVSVEIKPERIWDVKGDWKIQMTIDRSGIKEKSKRFVISNELVSSVVLSPFGNVLEMKNGYPNKEFVLRDGEKQYLYYKVDSLGEGQPAYVNFFGNMEQIDSLELIPVKKHVVKKEKGRPKTVKMKLKNDEIVSVSQHTTLKIKKLEQDKELLRIYFQVLSYDGADLTWGIENLNAKMWMKDEDSLLVMDLYDVKGKKNLSKIKQIEFLQQEMTLDEKSVIKVDLSK
ncbi:MAG: DUF4179 domain-containing protein [Lachnospiraceae bacterium]|nr:DUF4179 domain-containing protein [Lachnospiraceae bacterium]